MASQRARSRSISPKTSDAPGVLPLPDSPRGKTCRAPGKRTSTTKPAHTRPAKRKLIVPHHAAVVAAINTSRTPSSPFHQLSCQHANPSATKTGPSARASEARAATAARRRRINHAAGKTNTTGRTVAQNSPVIPWRMSQSQKLDATTPFGCAVSRNEDISAARNPRLSVSFMATGTAAMNAEAKAITIRSRVRLEVFPSRWIQVTARANNSPAPIQASP